MLSWAFSFLDDGTIMFTPRPALSLATDDCIVLLFGIKRLPHGRAEMCMYKITPVTVVHRYQLIVGGKHN